MVVMPFWFQVLTFCWSLSCCTLVITTWDKSSISLLLLESMPRLPQLIDEKWKFQGELEFRSNNNHLVPGEYSEYVG